jgi:murein DD-endopeptidase MepM/ murein hydrolase activator NlpD
VGDNITLHGSAMLIATMAGGLTGPALAETANSLNGVPAQNASPLTAHYDQSRRVLFIGTAAPAEFAPAGLVTISRASDLAGRQLRLVWTGAASMSGGVALPSSMPVAARAMTSGFGYRRHPTLGGIRAHHGVDLAAPTGSPIVATSDGRVGKADWNGGYGLFVSLEHGGGVETRYGHMSRLNVVAGQKVRKGDVIGYVGSTGRSTGPHLHYEVRQDGRAVNPAPLLNRR